MKKNKHKKYDDTKKEINISTLIILLIIGGFLYYYFYKNNSNNKSISILMNYLNLNHVYHLLNIDHQILVLDILVYMMNNIINLVQIII